MATIHPFPRADSDGRITPEELEAAAEAMRSEDRRRAQLHAALVAKLRRTR